MANIQMMMMKKWREKRNFRHLHHIHTEYTHTQIKAYMILILISIFSMFLSHNNVHWEKNKERNIAWTKQKNKDDNDDVLVPIVLILYLFFIYFSIHKLKRKVYTNKDFPKVCFWKHTHTEMYIYLVTNKTK